MLAATGRLWRFHPGRWVARVVITAWRRRCDAFGRGMTVLRDAFGMAVGVVRVIATAIGGMKVSPVLWRAGARGGGIGRRRVSGRRITVPWPVPEQGCG